MTPALLREMTILFTTEADAVTHTYEWPPVDATDDERATAEFLREQAAMIDRTVCAEAERRVRATLRAGGEVDGGYAAVRRVDAPGGHVGRVTPIFDGSPPEPDVVLAGADRAAAWFVAEVGPYKALDSCGESGDSGEK